MVVDPGCMKCMDCISVCPNDALYYGFGKPTVAVAKSAKKAKAIPRNYSLTWPEEIFGAAVFLVSFLARARRLRAGAIFDGAGLRRRHHLSRLESVATAHRARSLFPPFPSQNPPAPCRKRAGPFLAAAIIWIGLTAHSGWIRYHEIRGDQAFQQLRIPDELALAQLNPAAAGSAPQDRANIAHRRRDISAPRRTTDSSKMATRSSSWPGSNISAATPNAPSRLPRTRRLRPEGAKRKRSAFITAARS